MLPAYRDLGTGKTCFARGFVRARVGDPGLAVTSPSYLLDNTYDVADEDLTYVSLAGFLSRVCRPL